MYIEINEATNDLKWEIINKAAQHKDASKILSDIKVLNDFVTECCYDNKDWMEGRISTEESSMLTDLVWEKIGGDNLRDNFGQATYDALHIKKVPLFF
tara:strand:- start:38 stop:331 length:294 start_codon:yes stop_codon:yes gene_type:complete